MSFQVARTYLAVTKPDGTRLKKEESLDADQGMGSVGVKFVGESALKGYAFDLLLSEINRVQTHGVPMDALPERL